MTKRWKVAWESFWYRPERPHRLIAARIIVALQALWIVLSRPTLPELVAWPQAFWSTTEWAARLRFFLFLPLPVEIVLYLALIVALVMTLVGLASRASSLAAAMLLYHFAPLESAFLLHTGASFHGLTQPVLMLAIMAFSRPPKKGDAASWEFRWPVVLMQLVLAFSYFSAGIAKLQRVGLDWFTSNNLSRLAEVLAPQVVAPWGKLFIENARLSLAAAVFLIVIDFAVVLPVFWKWTGWIVVPAALFHSLFIALSFGIILLHTPLLLLLVDWEAVIRSIPTTWKVR